jgi:hypothetical protein
MCGTDAKASTKVTTDFDIDIEEAFCGGSLKVGDAQVMCDK